MNAVRTRTSLLALALLLAAACGSSGSAAPPPRVFHLGLFHVGLDHVPPSLQALKDALKDLGYFEGQNIEYDWRNQKDEAQADQTAKDFVAEGKDLIVAFENQTCRAAKAATSTIPVVMLHVTDPVGEGLVSSLTQPGGNITGLIGFRVLAAKQLEMFKNVLPSLHRVLVFTDSEDPAGPTLLQQTEAAASTLGLDLVEREVHNDIDIAKVFAQLKPGEVDGGFVASQILPTRYTSVFVSLAYQQHLPMFTFLKQWVEQGGLLRYGPDYPTVGRAAAVYVDKILKGANPGDLPVEEMTQLELVINKKVADQWGLTLSPEWLDAADEVLNYVSPSPPPSPSP
jgi:putative tryptophan/tyrosine transport system substrate-binding protein